MNNRPIFQDLSSIHRGNITLYYECLPHFVVPCHHHPSIEIMYIVEGTGTRFVGDHIESFQPGDVCMIGSNLIHEWRNDAEYVDPASNLRSSCYCLFFMDHIFSGNFTEVEGMRDIQEIISLSKRGLKFKGKTKQKIASLMIEQPKLSGIQIVTNLLSILEVAAHGSYDVLTSIGYSESVNSGDYERFNKVYKYLVQNFHNKITLDEVASIAGLSNTAFCRYFKKRTKKTFVQYLNELRIGHAKKMIIDNKMKLSTIATLVGFNNISHFIYQFKKATGMLPTDFQAQYSKTKNSVN